MFKANNIFENKIVTHQSKSITFKDDTKPIQIGFTDETTYKIKKGDTFYSLLKQLKINIPNKLLLIADAFRKKISLDKIYKLSKVDPWFLNQIQMFCNKRKFTTISIFNKVDRRA